MPLAAVLAALDASPGGLATYEARARLARYGPNRFIDRPVRPLPR